LGYLKNGLMLNFLFFFLEFLYVYVKYYPYKVAYTERYSCYSKTYCRHFRKSLLERKFFRNGDIKGEDENYENCIKNCETQSKIDACK